MGNKIDIISNSLLLLGEKPISDLNDGSDVADIINNTYPSFKLDELANYEWTFTQKQAQLNKIVKTPVLKYKNVFALPSDFLRIKNVYADSDGDYTLDKYSIKEDGLYCDEDEIYVEYSANVAEEKFPAYFNEYFSYAYAAKINMSVTESENKQALLNSVTPDKRQKAKTTDAMQEGNEFIQEFSVINVRS